jgi:hypothetical protein
MPAITVRLDDEKPASRAGPQPLSFQPTRKTNSGQSRAHEVHEKETMPSIQLKTEPLSPPPPSAPPHAIRSRVLAKSFDQDATESAAPAVPEPEPLPSILIDGLPSEPVRTELEMPALGGPTIPAARPSKPGLPKDGVRKPVGKNGKAVSQKPVAKEGKAEKTGERVVPKVPRPPAPVRTDTMVLSQVPDKASPGIPTKRGGSRWIWFVIPAIALAGVAGLIAWDVYNDKQRQRAAEEAAEAPEEPAPEVQAPAPKPLPVATPEPTEAPPPKVETPKKKPGPGKQPVKAAGPPGEVAMRALQSDFEKLVEESVQRKFRLQLSALEGQVDDKGSDPAFVKKVEVLHDQVKTALAKQQ